MKQRYRFTAGDMLEADREELLLLLEQNRQYLQNYLEVFDCLEDSDFVARGNGFCDTKYSEDFIEGQIEKYRQRISDIEKWLA